MISKEEEKINEIPEFNKNSARNGAATTECKKIASSAQSCPMDTESQLNVFSRERTLCIVKSKKNTQKIEKKCKDSNHVITLILFARLDKICQADRIKTLTIGSNF